MSKVGANQREYDNGGAIAIKGFNFQHAIAALIIIGNYEKEKFRHGGNVGKIFLAFLGQGALLKVIGYLRNDQLLNYSYYNHPHKMSESSNLWNTMANIPWQIF